MPFDYRKTDQVTGTGIGNFPTFLMVVSCRRVLLYLIQRRGGYLCTDYRDLITMRLRERKVDIDGEGERSENANADA